MFPGSHTHSCPLTVPKCSALPQTFFTISLLFVTRISCSNATYLQFEGTTRSFIPARIYCCPLGTMLSLLPFDLFYQQSSGFSLISPTLFTLSLSAVPDDSDRTLPLSSAQSHSSFLFFPFFVRSLPGLGFPSSPRMDHLQAQVPLFGAPP